MLVLFSKETSAQFTSTFINQTDLSVDESLYSTTSDSTSGAIYACGSFQNQTILEMLLGISNIDGTITRLDASGNIIWTNYITGAGTDEALSICRGKDGNLYVTGYYSQGVTFSTTSGSTISLANIPAGNTNPTAFIASYTPAGALRWAVRDGGSGIDYGMSITSTSSGIVTVGSYYNKNAIIQGISPAQNLNSSFNDIFITKYGFNGNPIWYLTGGSATNDYSGLLPLVNQHYDITSYNNQIIVTGMYGGASATFSSLNGNMDPNFTTELTDPDTTEDGFIISVDDSGSIQWGHTLYHGAGNIQFVVTSDCSGIYIGGNVTDFIEHENGNTIDFASSNDLFLSGYSLSGSHLWTKMLTSAGTTNTEYLRDIIVDFKGNIFFTGDHSAPMTIGSSVLPASTSEMFIAQYDNTGNYFSHSVLNGAGTDVATSLVKMANGKIVVGGNSNSDLDANQSIINSTIDSFLWGLDHSLNVSVLCCTTIQNAGNITTISSPTCQGSTGTYVVSGFSTTPTWQYSPDGVNYTDLSFTTTTISYTIPYDGFLRTKIVDTICGTTYSSPISVNIQEGPTFTCSPADRVIELTSCSTIMPNFLPTPNATCPTLVYSQNYPAGSTIGVGIYPIVIRDWDGNVVCNFNLRVEETNRPGLVCPSSIADLVSSDPSTCGLPLPDYTASATIFDECTASVSITQTPAPGTIITSSTLVELTATDIGGNTSTCQFIVNFKDTSPPTISACPNDTMIYVDQNCSVIVPDYITSISAFDNCDTNLNISQNPAAGSAINVSTTLVIKAEDDEGNVAQCNVFIYLRDTIAPVISGCPSSIGEPLSATCDFEIRDYTGHVTPSDNCGVVLFYQTPPAGTIVSVPTVVTLWAIDAQDNYTRCEILVSGFNATVPTVISCPSDQFIYSDQNCVAVMPDYTSQVVLAGNCISTNFVQVPAPGSAISNNQVTEIFYEGNLVCTFNVTPLDTIAPIIISALMDQAIPVGAGCTFVLPDYTSLVSATDNCANPLIYIQDPAAGNSFSGNVGVTIYAIDQAGNQSSVGFGVTGIDTSPPSFSSCPSNQTISNNSNCQYTLPDYRSLAITTDNCGILSLTQSPLPGTIHSGNTAVTLTLRDLSNNSTTCTFTVTGIDVTAPTISCPSNKTLIAGASCTAILPNYISQVSAQDNCDASLTFTQTPAAGTAVSGTTTVTIRATDDAGLFIQCTFTVTVIDNTAPVISNLINQTIAFNANCEFVMPNYIPLLTVTDNCDNSIAITQSPLPGTIHNGITNIQFTAIDDAGNNSQLQIQVVPVDNTPPSITCPTNKTVNFNTACGFLLPNYTSQVIISDNCAGINSYTFSQSPSPGTNITSATSVTITVTDQSFLSSSCSFLVTPVDITPPTITCPPNQSVNLGASCSYIMPDYRALAIATDNCTTPVILIQSPAPGTIQTGSTTVTLTASDNAGNSIQCTFSLTANDVSAPIVTCPVDRTLDLGSNCTVLLPDYRSLILATDNCDGALTIIQNPAAGTSYFGPQTQTITFNISDDAGNTSNCFFLLHIEDNTAPTISCPTNQIANQDINCNFVLDDYRSLATISDNCSTTANGLTITQTPAAGTIISSATVVSITAADASGNSSSCNFTVNIQPNTSISISCPSNTTVNYDANCSFILADYTAQAVVSTTCGASFTVSQSPAAGSVLTSSSTITLTATNSFGQQASCAFSVTPLDIIAPTITCIGTQNINTDISCNYVIPDYTSLVSVNDNCSGAISITQSPLAGTLAAGVSSIVITATDASNNSSTCSFDVEPLDLISPTITCPANQILSLDSDCTVAIPDYTALASKSDNCSGSIVITQSPPPGALATGTQNLPVTLTAEDLSGNTASCSFTVQITDNTAPIINCISDQTIDFSATCDYTMPDFTSMVTAMDECAGSITFTQDPIPGSVLTSSALVTVRAIDSNGNIAVCTFQLIPNDHSAPQITCLNEQTIEYTNGCSLVIPDYTQQVIVSDNCSSAISITQQPAAGTIVFGNTTIEITATDDNANSSLCSFDLLGSDTTNPTIICPNDSLVYLDQNCTAIVPDLTALSIASDNCAIASITQFPLAGATISEETIVTITTTDINGLMSSCEVVVSTSDTLSPTISCPSQLQVYTNEDCQYLVEDLSSIITTSDNCTVSPSILQSLSINSAIFANSIITFTTSDANGNSTSCDVELIVIDTISPSITCPSQISVYADGTCASIAADYSTQVNLSDECGIVSLLQSPAAGSVLMEGDQLLFTATDGQGNQSTCISTIILIDTIAPMLICPSDSIVPVGPDCTYEIPNFIIEVGVSDNCHGSFSFSQTPASGTIVQGEQTIIVSVSDEDSNLSTCVVNMITVDNEAPTILSCVPFSTVQVTDCVYQLPSLINNLVVTDNCDTDLDITQSITEGSSFVIADSPINVEFIVTDDNNQSSSCSTQIFLVDTIAPVIICPSDTLLYTPATSCLASLMINNAEVEVSCENIIFTNSISTIVPSLMDFTLGTTTITYTATDEEGNSSTCDQFITVIDTLAPLVDCPPNEILHLTENTCLAEYEVVYPTYQEACGIMTFSGSVSEGIQLLPLGNNTINYLVTDLSGNESQCTQTIEVYDLIAPIVTCNDSMFFESSSEYCGNLVILDAPSIEENCLVSSINSNLGWVANSPNYFDVGVIEFIWEVIDASGNQGTCTTVITITDVTPPVIECDSLLTGVTNEDMCSGFAFPNAPVVSDNCAILSITSDLIGSAPYTFEAGTSFITYTALDIHNNTSTCISEVRIDDIQAPTIICPEPISVDAVDACEAFVVMNNPTATDNCSTTFNIVNNFSGNAAVSGLFAIGETPIEYVVFDNAGQSATCATTITVVDASIPILNCQSTVELTVPSDACVAVSTYVPTSTDICGTSYVTLLSGVDSHIYSPGDYQEIWQASDQANNLSTCVVDIHVIDITPPSIACPNDTTICTTIFEFEEPLVSDNCTDVSWSQTNGPVAGGIASPGQYTIEYTAEDNYGLLGVCSFNYEVIAVAQLDVNFPIDSICANAASVDLNDGVTSNLDYTFDNTAPNGIFDPSTPSAGWVNIIVSAGDGACAVQATDSIYINAPATLELLADNIFCGTEGLISLNATFDNLNWTVPNSLSVVPIDEISFSVVSIEYGSFNMQLDAVDNNGCATSTTRTVAFEKNPIQPFAGLDQIIYQISTTSLNATCDETFNLSWSTDSGASFTNPNELNTTVNDLPIGTHLFIITNSTNNCGSLSDSIYVTVGGLEVPSGFSPNGDGTNDAFVIPGIENQPASLAIFNRWGKEVWKTDRYENDWTGIDMSGEQLQDDTYFYELVQADEKTTGYIIIKRQ